MVHCPTSCWKLWKIIMTTNLLFNFFFLFTFISFVYSISIPANSRPTQAKQPTTAHLLPTYTKLIMSDSSVLICCANFISKLHSLEESSLWQNGWAAWSLTPTWSHCQRCAMSCEHWYVDALFKWSSVISSQLKEKHCKEIHNTTVYMSCFTGFHSVLLQQ